MYLYMACKNSTAKLYECVTYAWPQMSLHVSVVITQLTAHLCERMNSY